MDKHKDASPSAARSITRMTLTAAKKAKDKQGKAKTKKKKGKEGPVLEFWHWGDADARPKIYIQAGLHADELPGMLVARLLAQELDEAAAAGDVTGRITIVAAANPIGLRQRTGGLLQGRVHAETGENFNRDFPDFGAALAPDVLADLGADAQENTRTIRAAMGKVIKAMDTSSAHASLRKALIKEAYDADLVLDLHADNEAQVHMYTVPALWPAMEDIAAEIDARAILLADVSGGVPFDEACTSAWNALAAARDGTPADYGCQAATLELGSNDAVDPDDAERQASALYRCLIRRGAVKGDVRSLPRLLGQATDLRAMQQVKARTEGVIVYEARLGDRVRKGDRLAQIIPTRGAPEVILAQTDGLFFARHSQRYAWPGKVIGKVQGQEILESRTGNLLTD